MKKVLLFNLFICLTVLVFGQSKLSLNTKHLVNSMKYFESKENTKNSLLKNFVVRNIEEKDYTNAYIHLFKDDTDLSILEKHGVKINAQYSNIITASIPISKLEEIATLDLVKYIQVGSPVRKLMDKARDVTMTNKIHSGLNLPSPFLGTGVVVGIIDMGFEYAHTNFYNFDKTDLRVKRVWNQTEERGIPPTNFSYGTEYKSKEEIISAKYDSDETHGTHVTGIAAGADTIGNAFYGIAGDAEIVLVSMSDGGDNVSVSDGMKYIYDYAASVGKPCVINMSLGVHVGPHDGTSTFDVLADQMQGKGKLLVGAAGNEGSDHFHLSKTFAGGSKDSLSSFISFQRNQYLGGVDIWGEPGMKYTIQLYMYDRNGKTVKKYYDIIDVSLKAGNEKLYNLETSVDGAQGSLGIVSEISPLNNKPHASIMVQLSSIQKYYAIGFTIKPLTDGTIHAWAEDYYSELTNNNINGFTKGDSEFSVGEIGGTGKRIISVGAYSSKNRFKDLNGNNINTGESIDNITSFSSFGPTADGRIKPEITAPGSSIGSSISSNASSLNSETIVNKKILDNKTYYYGMMEGTSMSSPCVTGILATWLQANKELSPEDIRTIFKKTAIKDVHTGTLPQEGNNTWGYGKINAYEGLKEVLQSGPQGITNSESVPAILLTSNDNRKIGLLFTQPTSNTNVSVFDVNGKMIHIQQIEQTHAGQEVQISMEGITPGVYIVKIANSEIALTSKIIIR